jgi:hypothetical protein
MKQNEIDYEQEKEILKSNLRICIVLLIILFVFCLLAGCTPKAYAVKVTFSNGTSDYYELNYKPKKGAKSIEYEGNTIFGIEKVEIVK